MWLCRPFLPWVLALGACLSACDERSTADPPTLSGICPSCEPSAGGETGDFGGTPSPCEYLNHERSISLSEAAALGFGVAELERRLAQGSEAPLTWIERGWSPPEVSGYGSKVAISVRVHVLRDDAVLRSIDRDICDGGRCRLGPVEIPEQGCPGRLRIPIELEIETTDRALGTRAHGDIYLVQYELHPGPILAFARIDLQEVNGALRLVPSSSRGAHRGTLVVELELASRIMKGRLWPSMYFDEMPKIEQVPIEGAWSLTYESDE